MSKSRYLTKSRFKLGSECATKLYYTGKTQYPDQKLDDPFLQALAEGGFQVGELAKKYYPGGHDIESLDYEEALLKTNELLKQDQVTIFEAAVRYNDLFIRVDILIKNKNHFELIEVKAKSYNKNEDSFFLKKGGIDSGWKSYLLDAAFQKYVVSKAFPSSTVAAYLMLADKTVTSATDGLNQKFRIKRSGNRKGIEVSNTLTPEDLSVKLLTKVSVDNEVQYLWENYEALSPRKNSFEKEIWLFAGAYKSDVKIAPLIGPQCKKCEFNISIDGEKLRSGFKECWKEALNFKDEDFNDPLVLEIWNGRNTQKYIDQQKVKLKDLVEEDIAPKESDKGGLSQSQRQWLQVQKANANDMTAYMDKEGLRFEFSKFKYPLHFIDFETIAPAIPFTKNRRPYEGVAFQFSHHTVDKDGSVKHVGEFLDIAAGFPNYNFLRALKKELEQDEGTIFRYSHHENTFLNHIYKQLLNDEDVSDKEELMEFIRTITRPTKDFKNKWEADRCMVDLCDLVIKYYYNPATRGSNSIKFVLPAILNSSKFLKEKYSKPIYGTSEIPSLNFKSFQWIKLDENQKVIDPYKQLPSLFEEATIEELELLLSEASEDSRLSDGGAAMTAYQKLQFTEMKDFERDELTKALKKYCELDTLAMVMIYEGWKAEL